nr:MAG TPA: hypothetical protein [Caudoviricetes sp.]
MLLYETIREPIMSNTVMPTDGFYKYLAQRIITQAIKDYQEAIDKKNGKLRADVESFIKSKWFDQVADTAGFGYCDFTARGKKRFLSRIKQNYYLKKQYAKTKGEKDHGNTTRH